MMNDLKLNISEYLPLRDVVFKTLREAILKGDLAPGERLMEIKLANQLGVSRTPIHEAIRKLELEGLVVMVPRKGAEVAKITEKDLRDVLEVRASLEELAISLACERITDEKIAELKDALEQFRTVIKGKDVTKIAQMDVAFHDVIFEATQNARLVQMVNNLREQMYRYRLEYLKDFSTHSRLDEEHVKIFEAVSARDIERATALIREHIYNQEVTVVKNIQE